MLMLKQILIEAWFERKRNKKKIVMDISMLIGLCICSGVLHFPLVGYAIILIYIEAILKRDKGNEMPEIICFIPLEHKANCQYLLLKVYITSLISCILFFVAFLIVTLQGKQYFFMNKSSVEYILFLAVQMFLAGSLNAMIYESEEYKGLARDYYIKYSWSIWQKVSYWVITFLCVVMVGWSFYLSLVEKTSGLYFVQKGFLWGVTLVQLLLYIYIIRKMLENRVFEDYNAKENEKVVEYEY